MQKTTHCIVCDKCNCLYCLSPPQTDIRALRYPVLVRYETLHRTGKHVKCTSVMVPSSGALLLNTDWSVVLLGPCAFTFSSMADFLHYLRCVGCVGRVGLSIKLQSPASTQYHYLFIQPASCWSTLTFATEQARLRSLVKVEKNQKIPCTLESCMPEGFFLPIASTMKALVRPRFVSSSNLPNKKKKTEQRKTAETKNATIASSFRMDRNAEEETNHQDDFVDLSGAPCVDNVCMTEDCAQIYFFRRRRMETLHMEPELLDINGYQIKEGGLLFLKCTWDPGNNIGHVNATHAVSTLLLNPRYENQVREAMVNVYHNAHPFRSAGVLDMKSYSAGICETSQPVLEAKNVPIACKHHNRNLLLSKPIL